MKVAPSILSVLNKDIDEVIKIVESSKVKYIHLDVMDNIFVPNKTFDYKLVKEVKEKTNLIVDTHLMIQNPDELIDEYIKTSSDYLVFHIEATNNPKSLIEKIHKNNLRVGISVKPNTKIEVLDEYLKDLDLVLVMSVEPGFGGQKFMEDMLEKVKYLKDKKTKFNYDYLIEIDGGINKQTAPLAKNAGCDIVVVGSYLFSGNINEKVEEIELL